MGVRSPLLKSYGDDFAWSLLDATPDATLIVAGSGEIVFVNDHAGELFGFDLEDLLGRAVDDLLPEALRTVHRAHRTQFRAESTVRAMGAGSELWARRSDGSEFLVEISLSPLHLDDDVFASRRGLGIVTERVEAQDQVHRVLRTLDATDARVSIFGASTLRFSFVDDVADGIGVPAEVLGGRGLTNMAERARKLGGDFTISPQPPGGSVLWQVPIQRTPQPA